jgi:xylulokinase
MKTEPQLLGIDLGTSGVKALLVTLDGQALASALVEYPILQPHPGHAQQEPEAWWQAMVQAVRTALGQVAHPQVIGIGLSGQMHGTVLLGRDHTPLAPAVIWPDRRSSAQVREITDLVGAERLYAIAGSPVATGFQAATLRWFQQQAPDLWAKVGMVLLPKDYLRLRLTGEIATDPSDAAGTLLLDQRQRDWSDTLLGALSIRRDQLPPLLPSAAISGRLSREAGEALGLPAGLPVATGAGDTPCSALGAGVVDPGQLLLTISTGGQLAQPCAEVVVDPQGRIHTFCSALEPGEGRSGWYQMGAMLCAGMALSWLRRQLYPDPAAVSYAEMMTLAAQEQPGSGGLLFLPYLVGERTPHMDPTARGAFFGLTLEHSRSSLIRAVVEGVTLAASTAYGVLRELGATPRQIVLAGGGGRSPFWQQMVADVFGVPVHALLSPEQSASGAAILAGGAVGALDVSQAARAWPRYAPPRQPDPGLHSFYQERLAAFVGLYERNAGHFG